MSAGCALAETDGRRARRNGHGLPHLDRARLAQDPLLLCARIFRLFVGHRRRRRRRRRLELGDAAREDRGRHGQVREADDDRVEPEAAGRSVRRAAGQRQPTASVLRRERQPRACASTGKPGTVGRGTTHFAHSAAGYATFRPTTPSLWSVHRSSATDAPRLSASGRIDASDFGGRKRRSDGPRDEAK